ncbi:shufflon system plasmid conjugative transfer pilus tip adhesin PilV [Pseudomonas sp. AB12(2023)]|uniref:shufflon system plasmid conjugative transfer pilus tip adhesin PilV n=1 Tax=Pseudomonas sp. AB12(2023) TaxID=3048597 RepID=UPI002B236F90|nr:shufflon system plasmid conjugative transfer pilus tip adhesin PilV [Pseudomonas sp. AB12(2023)]MEB0222042.1 shufflon system plasmid conjugative transfer pilus tip adhesin PilV [Pseudomonas sp. AB12(2023)]
MKSKVKFSHQRGVGLVETLFVLIIAAIALGAAAQQYSKYLDNISNKQASDHALIVADAAGKYIKDNYAAVSAAAGPSTPVAITVAMLKSTNYLSTSISDQNIFGQTYSILTIEPTPNSLQTLIVTTGGQVISELAGRRISQLMGATGGFVSKVDTSVATGSFGGWVMPLAAYSISPGAGHVATALFLQNGAIVNDYLYRNAVPGHPELNRMTTAIDMNGNNLANAGTVTAATVSASGNINAAGTVNAANAVIAGETTTGGWFRSTGDTGWYNQKWNGGWYMSDPTWIRAYADKNIYTGGQLQAGTVVSTARTTVGEYLQLNGVASEGSGCSPNGLVGRNPAGLTLSCQSGVWVSSVVPSGSLCGAWSTLGGLTAACQGYDPHISCPVGYHSAAIAISYGDCCGDYSYACAKD